MPSIENQGETSCNTIPANLDLVLLVINRHTDHVISGSSWRVMVIHTQRIKLNGNAVQKLEWKQTENQRDTTEFITFLANVVSKEAQHWDVM